MGAFVGMNKGDQRGIYTTQLQTLFECLDWDTGLHVQTFHPKLVSKSCNRFVRWATQEDMTFGVPAVRARDPAALCAWWSLQGQIYWLFPPGRMEVLQGRER